MNASDYDYAETRLTGSLLEMARLMLPGRWQQYQCGIITGGEFDCLYRHGVLPSYLETLTLSK